MSEFGDLIKEAFAGEEPFDPRPTRDALEMSIRKFDRRMRTVRWMTWLGVTFMGVVSILTIVGVLRAPADVSPRTLALYLMVFAIAFSAIGFMKFWLVMMQNDIGLRKELKRVQMMMLNLGLNGNGPSREQADT